MLSETTIQSVVAGAAILQLVAVVLQTVVFWITADFARKQINEIKHSRATDVHLKLFEELNSPTAVERRRLVYLSANIIDIESLPDATRKEMNLLVNQLDFLGFLVNSEFISFALADSFYQGTIIRSWLATRKFIEYERLKRSTLFAEYFEKLYYRCEDRSSIVRPEQAIGIEKRRY